MSKKSTTAIFALLLSLSITNAYAYTSYGVRGCGKLIGAIDTTSKEDKNVKDLTEISIKSWIGGYITAYNSWLDGVNKTDNSDVIAKTDIDGIWMSMLNYCRANPLNNMNEAMIETINQLTPPQKKKR